MAHRILVIDDDPHISEIVRFTLTNAGMQVRLAGDGASGLAAFQAEGADLVILDIGMPEMDGLDVCRAIRKASSTPILFLSARSDEIDRVLGLELGGDDYVVKPFSPRELAARVNAILKRVQAPAPAKTDDLIRIGALELDRPRFKASFAGHEAPLTAIEFTILRALAARSGQVLNREQIMRAAYPGNVHVSDRTIDSHVRNIRAKFAAIGCADIIETVHGVGLRLGPMQNP